MFKMGRKRVTSNEQDSKVRKKERNCGERRKSSKTTTNAATRRSKRIANERLTIPAGFFSEGIVSEVARKTSTSIPEATSVCAFRRIESRKILDEDLHGLLQPLQPSPTLKTAENNGGTVRTITVKSEYYQNVSNYYLSLLANDNHPPSSLNQNTNSLSETLHNKKDFTSNSCDNLDLNWCFATANANENFCLELRKQIKISSIKRTSFNLINKIKEIAKLCCTSGKSEEPQTMSSAQKRPIPPDTDDITKACSIPLVPQSQWVYSTPDKQNMKKFVFEDGSAKFLPAVFHTSKKTKVLYDIKNEYAQYLNLNKYKAGENVPIDKRFFKTICESTVNNDSAKPQAKKKRLQDNEKENVQSFSEFRPARENKGFKFTVPQPISEEYNMFLSKNAEESVNIGEVIEKSEGNIDLAVGQIWYDFTENQNSGGHKFNFEQCRSALPNETFYSKDNLNVNLNIEQEKVIPTNYQHQLLLATERPSKTTKKVERRHLFKAKCLSFENTPPSGGSKSGFEPKKLTSWKSFEYDYLDQFEKECNILSSEMCIKSSSLNDPHTITSGALNKPEQNNAESDLQQSNSMFVAFPSFSCSSYLPPWKFYPRRNFDPE